MRRGPRAEHCEAARGELAFRGEVQALKFGARATVPRRATGLRQENGCYVVRLDDKTDLDKFGLKSPTEVVTVYAAPSTGSACPVTYDALSDARKSTACAASSSLRCAVAGRSGALILGAPVPRVVP